MRSTTDNNSYTGSKGAFGMCEFLINNIPEHQGYYEVFAGSAKLFENKIIAKQSNVLVELDNTQTDILRKKYGDIASVFWDDAYIFLKDRLFFFTRKDFIYLDPPYPASSRKSKAPLYKCEMLEDSQHRKLLQLIKKIDANIMISTRRNRLYDTMLKGWYKKEFLTADRGGAAYEVIYMNYDISQMELHQYDYIGNGSIDRQRIKRKAQRTLNKIVELPFHERSFILQEIVKKYAAEVKTYLSV